MGGGREWRDVGGVREGGRGRERVEGGMERGEHD